MSITPWLPAVRRISDGESVDQLTVNIPIDQLTQREQHLYEKFEELLGKSVLISFGAKIHPLASISNSGAQSTDMLNVGELNIVYYRYDSEEQQGVFKAVTGFSSQTSSNMFSPKDSNYIFGLTKLVYPENNTIDLYTEGLCEFPIDIDDSELGLINKIDQDTVEEFRVGPYYLSPRSPGKITKDPSGIPVYVGYALSKRKFLLHTNVDEFSQFFINYRYHILDRVAGIPQLDAGEWSIASSDISTLGWISADSSGLVVPEGAKFFYNIPGLSVISEDEGLDSYDVVENGVTKTVYYERDEASELAKYIPPIPANFVQLYVDGQLLRYKDSFDTEGTYAINEYGIWWFKSEDGQQPWSASYPQTSAGLPINWSTTIKEAVTNSRKRIFVSFSKFNPALRTQLVSSLKPIDKAENRAANFIKFYNDPASNNPASTGDLLVDIIADVLRKGFSTAESSALSSSAFPALSTTFTSNRAIADFKYSKSEGKFTAAVTPVVAKLLGTNNISVTETVAGTGVWTIDYLSQGLTGQVDSIEPINSRLEFVGLTSYIKLPPPTTTPYGLIGKILLPRGYKNASDLKLIFHVFGDTAVSTGASTNKVNLQLEYSSVAMANTQAVVDYPTTKVTVNSLTYPTTPTQVEFSMGTVLEGYTANQAFKITEAELSGVTSFTIPAEFIREDSIVNFKITRVATSGGINTSYLGNVGILGVYWEI